MTDKLPHFETFSDEALALVLKLSPGKTMVLVRDDENNTCRIDIHHEDGRIDYAIPLPDDIVMALAKRYPACKLIMIVGKDKDHPRPGYDR